MKRKLFIVISCFIPIIACQRDEDTRLEENASNIAKEKSSPREVTRIVVNGKKDDLPYYLDLLSSRNREDRLKGIELLSALGKCDEAQEALMKVAENGTVAERCNAAGALRIKKAVPVLIRALRDTHPTVRRNAAGSLGNIGDKSAIDPLKMMLSDRDKAAQIVAATSLFKLGDNSGLPILEKALNDNDEEINRRARMALSRIDSHIRQEEGQSLEQEVVTDIPNAEARTLLDKIKAQ